MKIRNLKRKYGEAFVSVWPPVWVSSCGPGDKQANGEKGVLKSVKRLRDRLNLTMVQYGREHGGSLQWDEPPSLADVEKVLCAHLGEPIKAIGDLDV